jgi:hypothetical protein
MPVVEKAPASMFLGGHSGQQQAPAHAAEADPPARPAISPELVQRFHALVEEVTDELMQGENLDRKVCRADAITLLIATSQELDGAEATAESPLRYLLLEEQQKAAAALGNAAAAVEWPVLVRV